MAPNRGVQRRAGRPLSQACVAAVLLALLAALACRACGFVASGVDRRSALRTLGFFAAAQAVALTAGGGEPSAMAVDGDQAKKKYKSKFGGDFIDLNHPGCKRTIFMNFDGSGGKIVGEDNMEGKPYCERMSKTQKWNVKVALDSATSDEITFTEEGRSMTTRQRKDNGTPVAVTAKWDGTGIVFPDGSKWIREDLYVPEKSDVPVMRAQFAR
eukprot:CAMPEP_0183400290 /NCGR_PEP_ID=MMETSP0370-20130417/12500_1 /TAXON_ID=268820 /ORGANISM="Peridinium aciculiferum, Strain PAER-2" /LENGTH=212 /DNA_ID=CAMNT_0025581575 /DNA_START=42 /DNA_END=680 /DNA_ORIENTATION=-